MESTENGTSTSIPSESPRGARLFSGLPRCCSAVRRYIIYVTGGMSSHCTIMLFFPSRTGCPAEGLQAGTGRGGSAGGGVAASVVTSLNGSKLLVRIGGTVVQCRHARKRACRRESMAVRALQVPMLGHKSVSLRVWYGTAASLFVE